MARTAGVCFTDHDSLLCCALAPTLVSGLFESLPRRPCCGPWWQPRRGEALSQIARASPQCCVCTERARAFARAPRPLDHPQPSGAFAGGGYPGSRADGDFRLGHCCVAGARVSRPHRCATVAARPCPARQGAVSRWRRIWRPSTTLGCAFLPAVLRVCRQCAARRGFTEGPVAHAVRVLLHCAPHHRRPPHPVEYLAHYLLQNNPDGRPDEPPAEEDGATTGAPGPTADAAE